MEVWVLLDKNGSMVRLGYKPGTYTHASVFYTEEEALEAAEYFGGAYRYGKRYLQL